MQHSFLFLQHKFLVGQGERGEICEELQSRNRPLLEALLKRFFAQYVKPIIMTSPSPIKPQFFTVIILALLVLLGAGSTIFAQGDVTSTGTYHTSIPIPVPPGPGAPTLSLEYNSAAGVGIAGVGWDLSVGWPTLIARDTRFGTPTWDSTSAWVLGNTPLVSNTPDCNPIKSPCIYRTAPDALAKVQIDLRDTTPSATVTLPDGVILAYEPVLYDGFKYPAAPAGAETKVFAFLLKSVKTPNGYLTYFKYKHWEDPQWGRVAVMDTILYGPVLKDINNLPAANLLHQITFDYVDPTASGLDHFASTSFRFGTPVSFNNLLKKISVFAADLSGTTPKLQSAYELVHQSANATETRLPRLEKVVEHTMKSVSGSTPQSRTLRYYQYGGRNLIYYPQPKLIDVGADAREFPASLSGSESRPIRAQNWLFNPNGLLQLGNDQISLPNYPSPAPPSYGITKQWSLMDINGDGLLDALTADEKGPDPAKPWPTYEGIFNIIPGPKPAQQWVFINQGIKNDTLISTRVILNTDAPTLKSKYDPFKIVLNPEEPTHWLWQEGLGQMRVSMPQSVTSPEIRNGGNCPPTIISGVIGEDTRLWPYLPDGTFGGSEGSIGQKIIDRVGSGNPMYNQMSSLLSSINQPFIPRHNISASLSGWIDMNGDGVPDWVVTPGMIERFNRPADCLFAPHKPEFTDTDWYVALGRSNLDEDTQISYRALKADGPPGPVGLPLSFSTESGQSSNFGLSIPVGSIISAAVSTALNGGSPSPQDIAALIPDAIAPRGEAGGSSAFHLGLPSFSATKYLLKQANTEGEASPAQLTKAAGNFVMSTLGISLDVTLLSGGNKGRSQSRAEIIDFNADGLPDYLLYDSGGLTGSSCKGAILLFLNDGKGGFLPAQRINDGYATNYGSMAVQVRTEASIARFWADVAAAATKVCDGSFATGTNTLAAPPSCLVMYIASALTERFANNTSVTAENFLQNSTDALPGDKDRSMGTKFLIEKLTGNFSSALDSLGFKSALDTIIGKVSQGPIDTSIIGNIIKALSLEFIAKLIPAIPTCAALSVPGINPLLACDTQGIVGQANDAAKSAELVAHTVEQLAYPSRLNMLSKGFSQMDSAWVTQPANGISVQTQGLVDLNGDGLPDYVITRDALKQCSGNFWEVYWGTGTANLQAGRGFTKSPTCIEVPPCPADIKSRGYAVLPIQADFILQQDNLSDYYGYAALALINPAFILAPALIQSFNKQTYNTIQSFVTLIDYNQDGRPDLVIANDPIANGSWNPTVSDNIWRIYLNNGRGFDKNPLLVPSVSGIAPNVTAAHNVAYPGIKSGFSLDQPWFKRSSSSVDVSFVDVDGDGNADIAQRVLHSKYKVNDEDRFRAGIMYWSRASNAPQDLMTEERDPIVGTRTLVNYLPAARFQWKDGTPDGNPPPGGHRPAVGSAAYLVRSVISEPFMGRTTQRTAMGYDYKDPYFDPKDRAFAGFARITKMPLDPVTGNIIASSTSIISFSPQRENTIGGATQVRILDNSNDAPASEVLSSYIGVKTADQGPGPAQAYFSGLSQAISIEFPYELTAPMILDIGFDGRSPLADRSNRNRPQPITSADMGNPLHFDPELSTGGGLVLDGTKKQWIAYASPHAQPGNSTASVKEFTVELWINPGSNAGRSIILRHEGSYELALENLGELSFGVNAFMGWNYVKGGKLPPGQWSHVAASYDGGLSAASGKLRLFINGKLAADTFKIGTILAANKLHVGCAWDEMTNQPVNCFSGSIGELRIYPEAWKAPARITSVRTKYNTAPNQPNFGMPIEMWKYGDIAVPDDDVYEEISYAVPQSGCQIQNGVASNTRRVLKPDGTPGAYLGYSAVYYDDLPLGQVGTGDPQIGSGNPTRNVVYSGPIEVVSLPTDTILYTATKTRYKMPGCPGIPTETIDPMGAVTKLAWDSSCAFQLMATNALGHTVTNEYFGVNGVPYSDPSTSFGGFYGQIKSVTDANGGQALSNYDEWGRTIAIVRPYDPPWRPAVKTAYRNARCRDASGYPVPCDDWKAIELAGVTQVTDSTWDDVQHSYRVTHTFGDGQVQAEAVNDTTGKNDWLISGTQDYDALGRAITTYKPRYMPTDTTATSGPCPVPGSWCDCDSLKTLRGDPLRDPKVVAHVQTAYDSRGRVIRTYAPNVPACRDPSARDARGNLLCDIAADTATPKGHYTRFEYPAPGVVRTIDARGVQSVTRSDALGRLEWVEEYERTSSAPYSTVHYKYGRNGNVLEVKDIDGNTTFADYDALGRKTSSTDPDMGTWNYVYDKRGQLIEQYDAANALTRNQYDILGRLIRMEYWTPPIEGRGLCEEEEKADIRKLDIGRWIPLWKPELPVVMKDLWRHAPQYANQKSFTLLPERAAWEQAELVELPLQQGDLDEGVAILPLPFDFVLQPMWSANVEGEGLVPATEIVETAHWPAEHPLLVTTNGKILFVHSELETAIDQELASGFVAQPRSKETALYPLAHDLELSRSLSYALLGDAPDRRLVIQWEGVSRTEGGGRSVFRAILSERSYEIQYQYRLLEFSPSNAFIGIQYLDPATSEYKPVEFRFEEGTPASRRALTSLRKVGEAPLQFKNNIASGTREPLWSHFAFDADLTGFAEAELSFQHSWNTRCADIPRGSCDVDQMSVLALVDGEVIPLLSNNELTASESFDIELDRISEAPKIRVPLPENLLGKPVTFVFNFETIDGEKAVEKDFWILDQLNIFGIKWCTVQKGRQLEDVVERRYDSAEPFFAYDHARPIIDLTFDVPQLVTDRSPLENTVKSTGIISSAPGVSGRGIQVQGAASPNGFAYLTVSEDKLPAIKKAVTIEAWIKPAVQHISLKGLIGNKGTFALGLNAAGNIECLVIKGARPYKLTGRSLLPDDAWMHVAVTYDGDSLRCYLNGVPDGALQITGELDWGPEPLFIGCATGFTCFTGMMDEVRVFSTVRTPAEVLVDAQLPLRGGPPRGNVLDLRFADPQNWGADSSGSHNHADITRFLATAMPGIQGTAVQFDGIAQQGIVIPDAPSLGSDELTAEVWVKTKALGDCLLVGKWNGKDPGWRLALQEKTGQVRFEVRTRVQSPDAWTQWVSSTIGLPSQGNGWCGESAKSPTARKLWTAPATGTFKFTTQYGANWNTVIFIRDLDGNPLACNDDGTGTQQSWLQLDAVQGETYQVFVSGYQGDSGNFTLGISGPQATNTSFITVETINDSAWHHVAGVYDGNSLRVYIDGKPAHRTCRTPEVETEGGGISGGEEIPCIEVPEKRCRVEWEEYEESRYPTSICAVGSILNELPVFTGNYDPAFFPNHPSLDGLEDEIRISNYPKRDFEIAHSARLYSAYTNTLGREVEVRNGTSYEHVSYDLLGREVSTHKRTTLSLPGKPAIIGEYVSRTSYDNLGRAAALRYPDGEVVASDYDRAGTQISLVGYGDFMGYEKVYGKQPYLIGAAVNSTGKIANLQFGNGARTIFTYDEGPTKNSTGQANTNGTFGKELLSQQTTMLKSGETLQDQHYEYDPVGNLLTRKDFSKRQPPALHAAPLTANYTYDGLSRLTGFTDSLGATLAASGTYSYDPIGNLRAKEGAALQYGLPSVVNGTPVILRPHAVTAVTNGGVTARYLYDANGRLIETQVAGGGKTIFNHNIPGKISSIQNTAGTFTFAYDGNGERVHKVEQNRVTVEPFGLYRETWSLAASPSSKNIEKYYFAGGRRIARRAGQGDKDVFWYHPEHLGSTNLMTAADGTELQDAYSEYTPFGTPLPTAVNNSGTSPPNGYGGVNTPDVGKDRSGGFQFTGKELDDTGLYYYGARYYDPGIGRFVEPDLITPGSSSQALNRYSYVFNNPLRYIDLKGTQPIQPDDQKVKEVVDLRLHQLLREQIKKESVIRLPEMVVREPLLPPTNRSPYAYVEKYVKQQQEINAELWKKRDELIRRKSELDFELQRLSKMDDLEFQVGAGVSVTTHLPASGFVESLRKNQIDFKIELEYLERDIAELDNQIKDNDQRLEKAEKFLIDKMP